MSTKGLDSVSWWLLVAVVMLGLSWIFDVPVWVFPAVAVVYVSALMWLHREKR